MTQAHPSDSREPIRSSSDHQLIDQARAFLPRIKNQTEEGSDEAWRIRQKSDGWTVIATRVISDPDVPDYEVAKASMRDAAVAGLLTFMSTALPRLCDLADQGALAAHGGEAMPVPTEPTPEFLEPLARRWCAANGIDPDEPVPPHGEWPRWYDECGAFATMYRDIAAKMVTAPPEPVAWRPDKSGEDK